MSWMAGISFTMVIILFVWDWKMKRENNKKKGQ